MGNGPSGETRQLITFNEETGDHTVNEKDVEAIISSHQTLFQIVALCGIKGSGKTLLYRLLIAYLECLTKCDNDAVNVGQVFRDKFLEDFKLDGDGPTRGILMQEKPFVGKSEKGEVTSLVLDTEGFTKKSSSLYKDILMFCAAISSNLLYNVTGSLKQSDLIHLKFFVEYGKRLQRYGFLTVLQNLVIVIHDCPGLDYGINTLLEMHSTDETDFTLLTRAFSNCKLFALPPLHNYNNNNTSGISDDFIQRFCSLAWGLFVSMQVKIRDTNVMGPEEIMKMASYYIKIINLQTVQRPKALLRDSAMDHFTLLTKYGLKTFENKLKQIIRTTNVSSVYGDLFETAKTDSFKLSNAFPTEFNNLNWYKTQSFKAEGTCLGWRFKYQRQFDDKIEQLRAMQRKPSSKTQKQKIKTKKIKKQANEKAEEKWKLEAFCTAHETAIKAHNESLEAAGILLDQVQYQELKKSSQEFALEIFSQCLSEDISMDDFYTEQESKLMVNMKRYAAGRWEHIQKLKEEWNRQIGSIMKTATNVYEQEMEKATRAWVSDETFKKLYKSAKQTAINCFKQSAFDAGADEELFDFNVKKLKSTFSVYNKEVAEKRSKIEAGLKDEFENKVTESFALYQNHMKKCSEEFIKDQTYDKFILEHTEAVELAQGNFSSCEQELLEWKGYKVYEKRLMDQITAEYEKHMVLYKSTCKTNYYDEMYNISLASAKVYEREMEKATKVWISKKTFAEKHTEAIKEAEKFFKLHAKCTCEKDDNKIEVFFGKIQDSFTFLKGHMVERNKKNEQFLEGHFEKKIHHFTSEYATLLRNRSKDVTSEAAFLEGDAEILPVVLKQFKESCTSEELLWAGFEPAEQSLKAAVNAEKSKLWISITEETLSRRKMNRIMTEAVNGYVTTMKVALKGDNQSFDEQHKLSIDQARKSLTTSSFWSKPTLRSSLEKSFGEKVDEERKFFKTIFELQKNEGDKDRESQMLEVYKEAMDSGMKEVTSMWDCQNLHRSSRKDAFELNESDCCKEEGDLSFFWNKYKAVFLLQQNLIAMKIRLSEHEKLKKSAIETTLPFFPPNELQTSRSRLETGFFSFVKKSWNNLHGYVAVKYYQINGIHQIDDELMKQIMQGMEKFYLKTHDSLVKVFGYTAWPGSLGAVMEYVDDIDYFNVASQLPIEDPYFPVLLRTRLCVDVASAFVFLQSTRQLVIGDVTVDDVFVTRNARCKVGGFKFRNIINGDLDAESQRDAYCAGDALGIILYALVIGKIDDEFDSDELRLATVENKPCECSQALADEIENCISKGATALDACNHLQLYLEGAESATLLSQQVVKFTEFLEGFRENRLPHDIGGAPFDHCL